MIFGLLFSILTLFPALTILAREASLQFWHRAQTLVRPKQGKQQRPPAEPDSAFFPAAPTLQTSYTQVLMLAAGWTMMPQQRLWIPVQQTSQVINLMPRWHHKLASRILVCLQRENALLTAGFGTDNLCLTSLFKSINTHSRCDIVRFQENTIIMKSKQTEDTAQCHRERENPVLRFFNFSVNLKPDSGPNEVCQLNVTCGVDVTWAWSNVLLAPVLHHSTSTPQPYAPDWDGRPNVRLAHLERLRNTSPVRNPKFMEQTHLCHSEKRGTSYANQSYQCFFFYWSSNKTMMPVPHTATEQLLVCKCVSVVARTFTFCMHCANWQPHSHKDQLWSHAENIWASHNKRSVTPTKSASLHNYECLTASVALLSLNLWYCPDWYLQGLTSTIWSHENRKYGKHSPTLLEAMSLTER